MECSNGEDKGTVRSEPCEKKVVQTTKQDVLQKSSPSSPLAFSLRADLPAGRDRSLCWPARLIVWRDRSGGEDRGQYAASRAKESLTRNRSFIGWGDASIQNLI